MFFFFFSLSQHIIKKIRNSVLKSLGSNEGTRYLQRNGQVILWDYWQEAQTWDCEENQGHRIHHKLSSDAIDVNKASKMRNAFAFYATNEDMLNLMKVRTSSNPVHTGKAIQISVLVLMWYNTVFSN